jgi:hypothetical protein
MCWARPGQSVFLTESEIDFVSTVRVFASQKRRRACEPRGGFGGAQADLSESHPKSGSGLKTVRRYRPGEEKKSRCDSHRVRNRPLLTKSEIDFFFTKSAFLPAKSRNVCANLEVGLVALGLTCV